MTQPAHRAFEKMRVLSVDPITLQSAHADFDAGYIDELGAWGIPLNTENATLTFIPMARINLVMNLDEWPTA